MATEAGLKFTFLHGEEGGREIGKLPPLPANCVEIDLMRPCLIEADFARKRK